MERLHQFLPRVWQKHVCSPLQLVDHEPGNDGSVNDADAVVGSHRHEHSGELGLVLLGLPASYEVGILGSYRHLF